MRDLKFNISHITYTNVEENNSIFLLLYVATKADISTGSIIGTILAFDQGYPGSIPVELI